MKFIVTLDYYGFKSMMKLITSGVPDMSLKYPVFYKITEQNGTVITTKYRIKNMANQLEIGSFKELELETFSSSDYTMQNITVRTYPFDDEYPPTVTVSAHLVLAFAQILPADEADMYETQVMNSYWQSLSIIRNYSAADMNQIINAVSAVGDKVDTAQSDITYIKGKSDTIMQAVNAVAVTLTILDGINIAVSTTLPALILSNFSKLNKRLKSILSDYDPAGILSGTDQD